eukprot:scpid91718/ scgid33911/ 
MIQQQHVSAHPGDAAAMREETRAAAEAWSYAANNRVTTEVLLLPVAARANWLLAARRTRNSDGSAQGTTLHQPGKTQQKTSRHCSWPLGMDHPVSFVLAAAQRNS